MTAVTNRWTGLGVAPGTVVAASWRADRPIPVTNRPIHPDEVQRAFDAVATDLERVTTQARAQGRAARRAARAEEPLPAIHDAIETYAVVLESLPDEILRERAADVRQATVVPMGIFDARAEAERWPY